MQPSPPRAALLKAIDRTTTHRKAEPSRLFGGRVAYYSGRVASAALPFFRTGTGDVNQRDRKSGRFRIVTVFLGVTGFIALTSVALPDVPREEAAKPYQIL